MKKKAINRLKKSYKGYLLEEQGYICAYCMQSISKDNMKIEHLKPRHACTENEKLVDTNMVAVCKGLSDAHEHCDTKRGNLKPSQQFLGISPVQNNPNCEDVTYFDGGILNAVNEDLSIEVDINKKLNLNCPPLTIARNLTEQGFVEGLIVKAMNEGFEWTIQLLTDEINKLLQIGVNIEQRKFREFCLVEVDVLKRKIEVKSTI